MDEGDNQRQRLSISGWYVILGTFVISPNIQDRFHRPQEGEEGYDPSDVPKEKSSLQQLVRGLSYLVFPLANQSPSCPQSASINTPLQPYPDALAQLDPQSLELSDDNKTFLSQFLNPTYLTPRALETLAAKFAEESSLDLHMFLSNDIAAELDTGLRNIDNKANQAYRTGKTIPSHEYGSDESGWELSGPPHRFRYYRGTEALAGSSGAGAIIYRLRTELLPSSAFRAWLAVVTSLIPMGYAITARRFRPGLDYTLASAVEDDSRLDVCLGLTPDAGGEGEGWESGAWGGWEVSLCSAYSRRIC